ncbi:hypothetical protein MOJ79_16500 [Calidifontimicrobium sp. SYSU G02091]|uniref:hypothetical protein n=1 Tax=Calidifontimicrobium sp. SYSU G02091 TaxID=2926421 RepID=UPI001F532423|nr:hypothetical protein [Calidifontimicrobium sp. SYSU G02091]MCI1193436.1 hypothetical protein [Calidifontimicrobium sp. SYSU G02091]
MTHRSTWSTFLQRMHLGAGAAVLLALGACGGSDAPPNCPAGFTSAVSPPQGFNLAVCVVNLSVAQAYDILDYDASVEPSSTAEYTLSLENPGYGWAMPSPQDLDDATPARFNSYGAYDVYAVDKRVIAGTVNNDYYVFSFARAPRVDGTLPNAAEILPMSHFDYGMWDAERADTATPDIFARYSGGWYVANNASTKPPVATTYRGLVFFRHVDRNVSRYASREITGVTFDPAVGADGTLAGSIGSLSYTPTPLPQQVIPPLRFTSVTVAPDGRVTGTVVNADGFPPAQGEFEGRFGGLAGSEGDEFVARVSVLLPVSNPPVRAVGFIALKKQP